MNNYQIMAGWFGLDSIRELFSMLQLIAKNQMGLDELPFTLSSLENTPDDIIYPDTYDFIVKCRKLYDGDDSDDQAKELIKFLKKNPPEVKYENPEIPDGKPSKDEEDLIRHIFSFGIDLPGSKHNPYGHLQYFSSFFIDMLFGNFTDFIEYINSLSDIEIKQELERREGYCQFSPIFAPVLGLRMSNLEKDSLFTDSEKQKNRSMYFGNNEDKHIEILEKLLKLGADPNAHDINGFTPLHYAVWEVDEKMVSTLIKYGANPNAESRICMRPLSILAYSLGDLRSRVMEILIEHKATLNNWIHIEILRSTVESHGTKRMVAIVREAMPRDDNECENCIEFATKKCRL